MRLAQVSRRVALHAVQQVQAPQHVQQVRGLRGAQAQRIGHLGCTGGFGQMVQHAQVQGGVQRRGLDRRGGQIPVALHGVGEV
ncbi:hypothetical protein D3C87_1583220 [compost metagenome]